MLGSLFSGISGLNASSAAMSVIGDNIANVNTTGFKSSSVSFSSMFSQSLAEASSTSIGTGVKMTDISESWTSGSFENTGNATDLAISGKGLFVLQNDSGQQFYSRAGNFNFNSEGILVSNDGLEVEGYKINDGGGLDALGNISISGDNTYKNQSTSELSIGLNLDSGAEDGDEYTTTINVYDSLGNSIPLTLKFTKVAGLNEWDLDASISAATGSAVIDDDNDPLTQMSLVFDSTGKLTNTVNPTITLTLTNGAVSGQEITLDLVDSGASNGDVTGYPSTTMLNSQSQDGYPAGMLQSVAVDTNGVVTGSYSNGQSIDLYRIALADFTSYSGLNKIGNNLYTASKDSGQASIGIIGTGRLGTISPESLEMSNVDLATEFVKMITTQRAYQANSRVISTSDELLTELINIKR